MALTPRSFFRSPLLIVATIFSAAIALLGVAVFMSTYCTEKVECKRSMKVDRLSYLKTGSCDRLIENAPPSIGTWTERQWVDLATCFEKAEDYPRATSTAAWGVGYFPSSEALHNIRGYNLIMQDKWDQAVISLRVGLRSVKPTTGTMQNNLAWAGLFSNDRMTLGEARDHYRASLAIEPNSCEALHTGMWVEYGIASRSSGTSRDASLEAYRALRSKYAPCTDRLAYGGEWTAYEIAGTGIMDGEVAKLAMIRMFESGQKARPGAFNVDRRLVYGAMNRLDALGVTADIGEACSNIVPVRSALPACRQSVGAWNARH